ncbi:MAG TPA: hypothetical protein ENJ54_08135 [Chloroflexi bacterium]|nr:hypothetical protein [Chloroflexota bacterium]
MRCPVRRVFWLFLPLFLLAGCTLGQPSGAGAETAFVPPVASPIAGAKTPQPTSTPAAVRAPQPTTAPTCTNNLAFVADETIPDGTVVQAGQTIDKRWRVRNAGTCNWDGRYRLRHIAGQALGAPEEMALFPARAGTEATIRILFTAPPKAGQYFSTWQAVDPQGRPFGDPIYMQIVVTEPKATPTP